MNLDQVVIAFTIIMSPLIGLTVLMNWWHFAPVITLNKLYIPALDKTLNSSTDNTLMFDISFSNFNSMAEEYYDPINVTIYDSPYLNHSIANCILPKFNEKVGQVGINWVTKNATVNTTGLDHEEAMKEISQNGYKIFVVDVATRVRYDLYLFWKTGRRACNNKFDVKIGDTGDAPKKVTSVAGITVAMFNIIVVGFFYF